jgi:proline racemase
MNQISKEREAMAKLQNSFKDVDPNTLKNLLAIGNKLRQKINDNMGVEFEFNDTERKAIAVANLYDIITDPDINLEEE